MKRLFLVQSAVAAILALGVVIFASRLTELAGPALRWDVAQRHPATLPVELDQLLGDMAGQLDATLFVSPRVRMPSHLQDVEATTRALLQAMADASNGAFSFRVIDPDRSGVAGARYAASRRVSPIRVRRVLDDAESQAEIWSSLVLSRRGQPRRNDILVQGIENAHLPHLGALLAAHLRRERPQAAFALSAPPGFDEMPRYLSQHGPVIEVDVDAGAMPHDVDVLFWIEPRTVTPRHIAALKRFLAEGRTVVLAGSPWHMDYSNGGAAVTDSNNIRFNARPASDAWHRLLEPFGLRPLPDLVLDRNAAAAPVLVNGQPMSVGAPFHLRNLPAFRDFRPLRTPARGGLSFIAPGPLQIDPGRVAAAGYSAHVAATTTERARVLAMPDGIFGLDDLQTQLVAPKQNLMVLLTPKDPWAGQLLVLAASSPFRNGIVSQPGFGHAVFVADLARSFADPEQLVRRRVQRHTPPALPALSDAGRIGWRLLIIALVPALWLLAALWRLADNGGLRLQLRPARQPLLRACILVAAITVGWWLLRGPVGSVRVDTTEAGLHTPSPMVVQQLQQHTALQAELFLSPPSALPAEVRAASQRAMDLLNRAGVPVQVNYVDQHTAQSAGAAPSFEAERIRQDTVVTTRVYSSLRLTDRGNSALIPRLDGHTGRHLDFLLATALRRLDAGAAPIVTVVSDLPRLSPAEALEDFQKKGLSAPQGVDVYSHAKQLLTDYGYEVRHVSPRQPVLPDGASAVLWFQPRRNSTPVLTQLSQHLGAGGRAVVAMQHFNIQQRQYRGTGFETVHWPQPQFQDFDRYLRLFGVEQMREVLFDRTGYHLELDTQVNRSAVREYDAQRVALPFLIRAVGANLSAASPVTDNLGDLLFIWGNRFRIDATVGAPAGMTARVLATTTDQAWAYDWRGGWLPAQILDADANPPLPGPQPLVVQLKGRFPVVEAQTTDDGGTQLVQRQAPTGPPGSLLLIGSSEMFKDSHLQRGGFAHRQLLLNAVADAVYGPDLAALQGRHGAGARGFAVVTPGTRSTWRLAVIGGGPLLLGLVAVWRRRSQFGRSR